MKKLQLTFNGKYTTIHRIGISQQSQIYLGFSAQSQQQYAIKIEPVSNVNGHLQRQAKIYRLIKQGVGFPNLYWYGVGNQYRALVTDVYGPNLQQLLEFCGGKFSLKTVLMIFDQIMDRIQWVHSKSLVYGDICPENFLVGLKQKADKIFMVDFGNCKKYLDEKNKHIQFGADKKPYRSDIRFKSVHGHLNKNISRRDDLQSLGYMIIYFLKGKLPWSNVEQQQTDSKQLLMKQAKISIPLHKLCEGLADQFKKYFQYVRSLQFEQEPDYTWIKRLFKDLFDSLGYHNNRVLDWAQNKTQVMPAQV